MSASPQAQTRWNRPAQQDRSSRTEQRILAATERLMADRPFQEISVAEIAREANASVSSFYARFRSKEALLGTLFERHAEGQKKLFDDVFAPDRWKDAALAEVIRTGVPLIVSGYRSRQILVRAFLAEASQDARLRQTWCIVGDYIVARVTEVVASRVEEVHHPDPAAGVRICLEMAFATLAHRIQMHQMDDPDTDRVVDAIIVMILRYMGITESR